MGFHGVSGNFGGVPGGFKEFRDSHGHSTLLQECLRGFKGIPWSSWAFHMVSRDFRSVLGFQGVVPWMF